MVSGTLNTCEVGRHCDIFERISAALQIVSSLRLEALLI